MFCNVYWSMKYVIVWDEMMIIWLCTNFMVIYIFALWLYFIIIAASLVFGSTLIFCLGDSFTPGTVFLALLHIFGDIIEPALLHAQGGSSRGVPAILLALLLINKVTCSWVSEWDSFPVHLCGSFAKHSKGKWLVSEENDTISVQPKVWLFSFIVK